MNLISVYVAVGAITFVKCELGYSHFQSWSPNLISPGEWNPRKFENKSDTTERSEATAKPEDLKCQTKINKRLKKLIKSKVNSRLPELKAYILSFYQCVKVLSFRSFDEMLEDDLIPVTDFVYFVKDGVNVTEDVPTGRSARPGLPLKDYAVRVLGQDWTALIYDRIEELLRTHSVKFQLGKSLVYQGRSRRRDHRMFAMMVMGFMIMASILIPMGFQFLTVLGGKSLLLAKLALIMSAINGLKKIATSNVGYGFYHTGSDGHHHDHIHHGFHEKHYNAQNYNLQGYN